MECPVVEARNFRKTYGNFVAVDGISFEVQQSEIFGLLGPNGAGKTSTLESLEGLRAPDGGTLRVAGVDPTREPGKLRNLIGVQLQSSGLPESITPDEAMKFFCAYHGVAPRFDLLERLGLNEKPSSTSSPPASSGAWGWPWPWPTTHRCFSWTNPRPVSTWLLAWNCTA